MRINFFRLKFEPCKMQVGILKLLNYNSYKLCKRVSWLGKESLVYKPVPDFSVSNTFSFDHRYGRNVRLSFTHSKARGELSWQLLTLTQIIFLSSNTLIHTVRKLYSATNTFLTTFVVSVQTRVSSLIPGLKTTLQNLLHFFFVLFFFFLPREYNSQDDIENNNTARRAQKTRRHSFLTWTWQILISRVTYNASRSR